MTVRDEYSVQLRELPLATWSTFLTHHSGLPGPRANLELIEAYADVAPRAHIEKLATTTDEYLLCCATVALGRLIIDEDATSQRIESLLSHAANPSWRVREACAMSLQRVGDSVPETMLKILDSWNADANPLVQRARIAAVCEPRLLVQEPLQSAALRICQEATDFLIRIPDDIRRSSQARTLRKGLGYCWSVAIAGSPAHGLKMFAKLQEATDADVVWVVKENLKKKRLQRLVAEAF